MFSSSSAGRISLKLCTIGNSGNTVTASTASAGVIRIDDCTLTFPLTTSSTAGITILGLEILASNTTCLTVDGSTTSQAEFINLNSGTASGISIGASGDFSLRYSRITSSNANAITGAGNLRASAVTFDSTTTINPTTLTPNSIGPTNINRTQPAFLAVLASADTNVTGNGTLYVVGTNVAYTEIFDQANNFSGTTFTAPVTGRYHFDVKATFNGITIATSFEVLLVTSNRFYDHQTVTVSPTGNYTLSFSVLADMDSGDTANMSVRVSGEAADTVDLVGAATVLTSFSGFLAC